VGLQGQVEVLYAQAEIEYFNAVNNFYSGLSELEQSGIQEILKKPELAIASYDRAIAAIEQSARSCTTFLALTKRQVELNNRAGPEPGFEPALKALNTDALIKKLVDAQVIPNRPELFRRYVEDLKAGGAAAVIESRNSGIEEFRSKLELLSRQLQEARGFVQKGTLIQSIDDKRVAAVLNAQQIFNMINDRLASACIVASLVSKEARGKLGW
jgi:hypothetical protein